MIQQDFIGQPVLKIGQRTSKHVRRTKNMHFSISQQSLEGNYELEMIQILNIKMQILNA